MNTDEEQAQYDLENERDAALDRVAELEQAQYDLENERDAALDRVAELEKRVAELEADLNRRKAAVLRALTTQYEADRAMGDLRLMRWSP